MDHDRLFNELFFEDIAHLIDRSQAPVFLDKELFGERMSDLTRELDLVARVRLAGGEAHFLVHLETQAQPIDDFPEKMFR